MASGSARRFLNKGGGPNISPQILESLTPKGSHNFGKLPVWWPSLCSEMFQENTYKLLGITRDCIIQGVYGDYISLVIIKGLDFLNGSDWTSEVQRASLVTQMPRPVKAVHSAVCLCFGVVYHVYECLLVLGILVNAAAASYAAYCLCVRSTLAV